MSFTISDLFGVSNPTNDIVNSNGTINFGAAEDWIRDNIDGIQDLFGDRGAGLHIGRAQSGLIGYSPGLGLGFEGGLEATVGFGGSTGRGLFGQPSLDFGVTVAGAIVGGVDYTVGGFDIELSNEAIIEPAVIFGGIEDLQGLAAGVEFTITVNGVTGGFGAVVPASSVDDVIANINQQLAGTNFSTSGAGRQAIADILSDIFPDGSMLIGLGGRTTPTSTGASLIFEGIVTGVGSNQDAAIQALRDLVVDQFRNECFLAGTMIDMWPLDPSIKPGPNGKYNKEEVLAKVWQKPIEDITPDDWVLSFDKDEDLVPGKVTRTFQNDAKIILDFHGTFVTPGHVYYRHDSNKVDKFEPLIDILRDDGVIQDKDGKLIRAATGCEVGSPDDEEFWAFLIYEDEQGQERVRDKTKLRYGTRWMNENGHHFSMRHYLEAIGVEIVKDGPFEGYARWKETGITSPFAWVLSDTLPKPEDFVLSRSGTTLEAIYKAGQWESMRPSMPAPMILDGGPVHPLSEDKLYTMPRNEPLAFRSDAASSEPRSMGQPKMNRKQRKAAEAKARRTSKNNRPRGTTLH